MKEKGAACDLYRSNSRETLRDLEHCERTHRRLRNAAMPLKTTADETAFTEAVPSPSGNRVPLASHRDAGRQPHNSAAASLHRKSFLPAHRGPRRPSDNPVRSVRVSPARPGKEENSA